MVRGWHLDSGILVRLVTNLAVYKIKIMADSHSASGCCCEYEEVIV